MENLKSINGNFSTTKLLNRILDEKYLNENGLIKNECKFKINLPLFKIQNSKFIGKPEDKFETLLFLPEKEGRKGEGGLRTKGYLKFSYKKIADVDNGENDNWYICDFYGNTIERTPENIYQQINSYIKSLETGDSDIELKANEIRELPLITVITVVFNGAKYLEETIQSVINQTYPNVEYIIIDGGSTDGTLDIIKKYEDFIDYWVSEPDKGIYDAMNKGIMCSWGEWINYMNAGDKFSSLSKLSEIYLTNRLSFFDVVYGDFILNFGNYSIVKKARSIDKIKFGMCFNHQSTFVKTHFLKKYGFNTKFVIAADYDLFLKLKKIGANFFYINTVISEVLPYGVSDINRITAQKENHIIRKENNFLTQSSLFYYYYKLASEIIKKYIKNLLPDSVIELIRKNKL